MFKSSKVSLSAKLRQRQPWTDLVAMAKEETTAMDCRQPSQVVPAIDSYTFMHFLRQLLGGRALRRIADQLRFETAQPNHSCGSTEHF